MIHRDIYVWSAQSFYSFFFVIIVVVFFFHVVWSSSSSEHSLIFWRLTESRSDSWLDWLRIQFRFKASCLCYCAPKRCASSNEARRVRGPTTWTHIPWFSLLLKERGPHMLDSALVQTQSARPLQKHMCGLLMLVAMTALSLLKDWVEVVTKESAPWTISRTQQSNDDSEIRWSVVRTRCRYGFVIWGGIRGFYLMCGRKSFCVIRALLSTSASTNPHEDSTGLSAHFNKRNVIISLYSSVVILICLWVYQMDIRWPRKSTWLFQYFATEAVSEGYKLKYTAWLEAPLERRRVHDHRLWKGFID